MKNKRSKLLCIILIITLLISTISVLASCGPNDPACYTGATVIEFYVGDEVIESYTLEGITIDRFPKVEPKDGKVFFEWCSDYKCDESFSGMVVSEYPIRNGAKLKLYAKMVDPQYIEVDGGEVKDTNEVLINSNYNSAVIFEDLIFVGEGVDYTVYSDESFTTVVADYAYTMVKDEKKFYIKVNHGDVTRNVVLRLYNEMDARVNLDCYIYSENVDEGQPVFYSLYDKDLELTYYAGDTINLLDDYLAKVNIAGYEIIGFTLNYPIGLNSLDNIDFIDASNYEVKGFNTLYLIVKAI